MIQLVRPSGKIKPIGETCEVFKTKSQPVQVGDHAEILNFEGETLNIARVTGIAENGGVEVIQIVMIA